MEYLSNLPDRLKNLMFDKGEIKPNRLGEELQIAGSSIREWLRGESIPSLANALKIADYFCCSLDFLSGRSEKDEEVKPRELPPFYQRLREVMKREGVTRYRISHNSRIRDPYFTHWAKGEQPNLNSVCILADYLQVSLDYLVGRRDY